MPTFYKKILSYINNIAFFQMNGFLVKNTTNL